MKPKYFTFILAIFSTIISFSNCLMQNPQDTVIPRSVLRVPTRVITKGPGYHWFGYYDKLQFDPTDRYVLSTRVDFEGRSPRADDTIHVGIVDLENEDRWIQLGTSVAWSWQQGCMLQFIPGSESEVIWNDRRDNKFVCHIKNIFTGEQRTLPFPIYTLSPDGRTALSVDFERINDLRPGYGYAGIKDPYQNELAPEKAGIYRCDLVSGEEEMIISIAQMNRMHLKTNDDPAFDGFHKGKNWFNHLLVNTDDSRFVFLHRWKSLSDDGFAFHTLMYSSDMEGKDIRLVDDSGYTSHFIWRDPDHLAMCTKRNGQYGFYLFKDDGSCSGIQIGTDVMIQDGHISYLPDKEWILNDTYPDYARMQHVYLFNVITGKRIPLGDFYLDPEYKGEWRCDTHPRFSPDGTKVVIDCPVGDHGRQLVIMDIKEIVTAN